LRWMILAIFASPDLNVWTEPPRVDEPIDLSLSHVLRPEPCVVVAWGVSVEVSTDPHVVLAEPVVGDEPRGVAIFFEPRLAPVRGEIRVLRDVCYFPCHADRNDEPRVPAIGNPFVALGHHFTPLRLYVSMIAHAA
jgi:hypothetical protein